MANYVKRFFFLLRKRAFKRSSRLRRISQLHQDFLLGQMRWLSWRRKVSLPRLLIEMEWKESIIRNVTFNFEKKQPAGDLFKFYLCNLCVSVSETCFKKTRRRCPTVLLYLGFSCICTHHDETALTSLLMMSVSLLTAAKGCLWNNQAVATLWKCLEYSSAHIYRSQMNCS